MDFELPKTEYACSAVVADVTLTWAFRFPETTGFLGKWITGAPEAVPPDAIRVSEAEFAEWAGYGSRIDGFAEFCLLCQQTSEALLKKRACIFHAGAVRFRDRAFLIAAGSGVGKTTQIRTLQELWPGEIGVINGDKPALVCRDDGTVMVLPSPWTGKEGLHGAPGAPLGGVFFLERGEENAILPVTARQAAPFMYINIFQAFADSDGIRRAGEVAETILNSAPVWRMINKGVPDSTRLMYDTMLREVTEHGL